MLSLIMWLTAWDPTNRVITALQCITQCHTRSWPYVPVNSYESGQAVQVSSVLLVETNQTAWMFVDALDLHYCKTQHQTDL